MTDSSPSEFAAAHELKQYPPEAVLELIEAARLWRRRHVPGMGWRVETTALVAAVDALGEGRSGCDSEADPTSSS